MASQFFAKSLMRRNAAWTRLDFRRTANWEPLKKVKQKEGVPCWPVAHMTVELTPMNICSQIGQTKDFGVMSAGSQFERFLETSGDVAVDRIWDFAIGRCPALDPKDEPWHTAAGRWDGGLSLLHVWAFHITTK